MNFAGGTTCCARSVRVIFAAFLSASFAFAARAGAELAAAFSFAATAAALFAAAASAFCSCAMIRSGRSWWAMNSRDIFARGAVSILSADGESAHEMRLVIVPARPGVTTRSCALILYTHSAVYGERMGWRASMSKASSPISPASRGSGSRRDCGERNMVSLWETGATVRDRPLTTPLGSPQEVRVG